MNDLGKGSLFFILIFACTVLCYFAIIDVTQTFSKNKQYVHDLQTKAEQCNRACYPFIVTSSEKDFCLCAGSSTVIWRKDIK